MLMATCESFYFAKSLVHNIFALLFGDVAQLARALAWHARGQGFESPYLHLEAYQKKSKACKSMMYRLFYI